MLEYIEGDIFNSPAQVIVNTVNTVGVMGKGLALSFKRRYPSMFEAYRRACEKKQLTIGKLMLYYAPDHWILMFPTKENWRNPSKIEYLEAGLSKFVRSYADKGITSIAFPRLGCGNGELLWENVKPVMERYLKPLPITVYIYLGPNGKQTPEHQKQQETMDWLRMNAKDMSFQGLCDDIKHGQLIVPYQIQSKQGVYSVSWKNGLTFTSDTTQSVEIPEVELFDVWCKVRNLGVFSTNEYSDTHQLFFQLLEQLGYLSPVRIFNEQQQQMMNGYQANEGFGRVFALRGEEA